MKGPEELMVLCHGGVLNCGAKNEKNEFKKCITSEQIEGEINSRQRDQIEG